MENKADWHGKPVKKGEETQKALDELTQANEPERRRHFSSKTIGSRSRLRQPSVRCPPRLIKSVTPSLRVKPSASHWKPWAP